jgi:hypothetical protein
MSYINKEEAIRQIEELQSIYVGQYFYVIGRALKIIKNMPDEFINNKHQVKCIECKFSRPLDRTKSPEKYFRDDCIVCECENVVGDEPMIYLKEHYCSFGKVDDRC